MSSAHLTQLSSAFVLHAVGRHARRYLNARLSNNITSLAPQTTIKAAALSAQGKTLVLAQILAGNDDTFLLLVDGGDRSKTIQEVLKFKVADDITLSDPAANFTIFHLTDNSPELAQALNIPASSPPHAIVAWKDSFIFQNTRLDGPGLDCLIANSDMPDWTMLHHTTQHVLLPDFEQQRLAHGQPAFPQEINEESLISETGPQQAISFTKGCYVGQEVVARIDSRGRPPRRLVRITGLAHQAPFSPGSPLAHPLHDRPIGEVVSSCTDQQTGISTGFAFVKNDERLSLDQLTIAGVQVLAAEVTPTL